VTHRVHLAGDSTMSIKEAKDYPETGWGVPFATFFRDGVQVLNYAKNGRSTRTFISEGRWQQLIAAVKKGDIVFIQFGHNDESERKLDRYTTPNEYKQNLKQFIADVREKHAQPVLLTSIIRRYFDADGKLKPSHPYTPLVRELAKEDSELLFIDMERLTWEHFEQMGDRDSAIRFMHIPPRTHPNYPNGVRDNTHLNALGAREVAQLLLKELTRLDHPLSSMTRAVDPKHLRLSY